jgi:hypothetical protein
MWWRIPIIRNKMTERILRTWCRCRRGQEQLVWRQNHLRANIILEADVGFSRALRTAKWLIRNNQSRFRKDRVIRLNRGLLCSWWS